MSCFLRTQIYSVLLCLLFMFAVDDNLARKEKYICTSNHIVELVADKIVFFESPDFPRSLTKIERSECYINFTKPLLPGEINKTFVVAVTHKICNSDYCPKNFYALTNIFSYFFTFLHNDDFYDTLAFQGYVHFDDWAGASCPFESVSRIDPFEFTDVSQIIALKSAYSLDKSRKNSCLWQFKAPNGYGFKVVITSLDIDSSTILEIQNSHDVIIRQDNQTKVKIAYPYYTTDNYLKIFLSENINSYWPLSGGHSFIHHHLLEFTGYLTIVKNNFDEVLIDCVITRKESHILWSYTNTSGYPNQAKCSYILTISPNTEVIIGAKRIRLEPGVDFISFYDLNNSMEVIHEQPNDENIYNEFVLTPGDYNTERAILCEFKGDGSVVSQGFEMDFEIMNCTCANSNITVSCSDLTSINLMNPYQNYYCGNLNCNYSFKLEASCTKQFIILYFNFDNNYIDPTQIEFDVFTIFSNNETLFSMNYMTWGNDYKIIAPENNLNIFQAITVPSTRPKFLTLQFSGLDIATVLPTIILNSTKPYFYHDLRSDPEAMPSLMQIELSFEVKMKNATIDVYLFELINLNLFVQFYTDTTLMHPLNLEKCFVEVLTHTNKCKTNLHSLVILQIGVPVNFFVQATIDDIPLNAEGCMFKRENIAHFLLGKSGEKSYTAMSNDKSSCKVFFYNYDQKARIKNFYTNPNANGTINIFVGTTEKLLASIDAETASFWRDIYAKFYLIEIPINTTIMVTCYEYSENINSFLNITTYPYVSVVTSLYFGDDYGEDYDSSSLMIAKYVVYNFDIRFILLEMEVSSQNYFYFIHNDTYYNISSKFHSMTFPSGDIELWQTCISSVHCVIRLRFETVDNTPTKRTSPQITTPKMTTRSTPPLLITTEQALSSFIGINYSLILLIQTFRILFIQA